MPATDNSKDQPNDLQPELDIPKARAQWHKYVEPNMKDLLDAK